MANCAKCGCKIVGLEYSHNGKKVCFSCHEKIIEEAEKQEQEKAAVFSYLEHLFGVGEIPSEVISGIAREVTSGKTLKGIRSTIRYYYEIEGNTPSNILQVPFVIRDHYDRAREYVRKMQQLKKINEGININVPPRVITLDPNKLGHTHQNKPGYNIEDL